MEKVLVTGGAGFIGCNFVRQLLRKTGARVLVLDKLTYAGNLQSLADVSGDPRYSFIQGDIVDRALVRQVFADFAPTALVNFAAESHVDRSIDDPGIFIATNATGTFELLEAARLFVREDPKRIEAFRFLHVSTDEVYGSLGDSGLFSETTPYAPNSPYAASKAAADHFVRAYQHTYGLPTLTTNCSNNYGPYQYPEKLIPLMILNAIEGKPLPIYGDGGNVRDWLFVEDHCDGILRVLEAGTPGNKYNIGGHNERTNLQIVTRICTVLEELLPAARNPILSSRGILSYSDLKSFVPDRPGHDRRYAIDATLIREQLGWRPQLGFDAGIRQTVKWYLENREWCEAVQSGTYHRERLGLKDDSRTDEHRS